MIQKPAIHHPVVALLSLALLAFLPAPAEAQLQQPGFGYRLALSASGHRQGFTRLGSVEGTLSARRSEPGPAGPGRRRVDADIRAQAALHESLSLEWRAAGPLVVRASVGHQSTTMEVGARSVRVDGSDRRFFDLEELGHLRIWTGSIGLQWRFGRTQPVVRPYLGVGLGASHWTIEELERIPRVEEVVGDSVGLDPVAAALPAAELHAGVDLPLGSRFRIRLEASDHVSRNPIGDDDFRLGEEFEATGRADDWVHTLRGGVGIRMRVF